MSMEDRIKELVSNIRQDVCKAHNSDNKAHIRTIEAYIALKTLCNELESSGLIAKNDPIADWEQGVIFASNDAIQDSYKYLDIDIESADVEDEVTLELLELGNIISNVFFSGAIYGSENPRPKTDKQ